MRYVILYDKRTRRFGECGPHWRWYQFWCGFKAIGDNSISPVYVCKEISNFNIQHGVLWWILMTLQSEVFWTVICFALNQETWLLPWEQHRINACVKSTSICGSVCAAAKHSFFRKRHGIDAFPASLSAQWLLQDTDELHGHTQWCHGVCNEAGNASVVTHSFKEMCLGLGKLTPKKTLGIERWDDSIATLSVETPK